jgi:hypothetical protein
MALVLKDRVRESTTTSGTGTLTLDGAVGGFQGFSVIGNGNTTYYAIVDVTTGAWEVGVGTYTSSGPTLSRDTVLESSSGGTLVAFTSNIKDVFCTYPAERAAYLDSATNATIPGLTLSGGTANGVAFLNASKVLTTGSALFFDGTNLGIGTSSPGTKLDVIGSIRASASVFVAASGVVNFNSGNDENSKIGIDGSAGSLDYNAFNAHRFFTNNGGNAERMRIDSAGNVGIGTSSPSNRLDVAAPLGVVNVSSSTGTNYVKMQVNNTGGSFQFAIENSAGSNFGAPAYARVLWNDGAYPTVFYTSSTERMRIDSAGNVGIGKTNPQASLDYRETINVISTNTTAVASRTYVFTATLTLTLPSSPAAGDMVMFANRSATATPVIGRNGQNIMGVAEDMTVDNVNYFATLVFADATRGWVFQ